MRNLDWIKISGLCGIAGPFFAIFSVFLAIYLAVNFSWTGNALSDLGVSEPPTSSIFNIGLIASGAMFFVYSLGLMKFFNGRLPKLGASILLITAVDLSSIGIFTENYEPTHFIVSAIFFLLFPISTLIFAAFFWTKQRKFAIISLASVFVSLFSVVAIVILRNGIAIPETSAAISMFVMPIILGFRMMRQKT